MDESPALVHQVSNESRASITESLSEFFDAQEVLLSASSSENEVSTRVFQSASELFLLTSTLSTEPDVNVSHSDTSAGTVTS